MTYVVLVATAGSFLLLFASIFPGILDDFLLLALLTSCLWFPALGIGGVVFLVGMIRKPVAVKGAKPGPGPLDDFADLPVLHHPLRGLRIISLVVLTLNMLLWTANVPRRLAFAFSRPAFESHLDMAPTSRQRGVVLNRRLGIYQVDRLAADPRGGVYFRTHAGADGIGPDIMSHGFAYRPNPEGTPFGRSGYSYFHLFGDWYSFAASDDY